MVKVDYSFDDYELSKQVNELSKADVKTELREVMKLWNTGVCKKLLPKVLSTDIDIVTKINDGVTPNAMHYANLYIAEKKTTVVMHSFITDNVVSFDEFDSREKARLFAVVMAFASLFSGFVMKFKVPLPGNMTSDSKVSFFGCGASGILRSYREVDAFFKRCSSISDMIEFMTLCGFGKSIA